MEIDKKKKKREKQRRRRKQPKSSSPWTLTSLTLGTLPASALKVQLLCPPRSAPASHVSPLARILSPRHSWLLEAARGLTPPERKLFSLSQMHRAPSAPVPATPPTLSYYCFRVAHLAKANSSLEPRSSVQLQDEVGRLFQEAEASPPLAP